jgi:chorismate synthase
MGSVWGKNVRLSLFGESHGKAIGINIDGLPSGIELDLKYLKEEMEKRAPGRNSWSTPRREEDQFEIVSGYFNGRTTGTPLCAIIRNTNQNSGDYERLKNIFRPGHADYSGYIKYKGYNDYRGGGHFSGRLTAGLVLAGAIAQQILGEKKILIGSQIKSIGHLEQDSFLEAELKEEFLKGLKQKDFPVTDDKKGEKMKELILKVKEEQDSVGGVLETAVLNLPAGIGSPFFDSVESCLAQFLFSIPAVKGVEFGAGFGITRMKGSEANDQFYYQNGKIQTYTNYNGGILGGITIGSPLIFRTAFKPTPSIGKKQRTVSLSTKENIEIELQGRHDPCIVPRAVPVVEGAAALVLLDLMLERGDFNG